MTQKETPPYEGGDPSTRRILPASAEIEYPQIAHRHTTREAFLVRTMDSLGVIRRSKTYLRESQAFTYAQYLDGMYRLHRPDLTVYVDSFTLLPREPTASLRYQAQRVGIATSRREAELQRFGYSDIPEVRQ